MKNYMPRRLLHFDHRQHWNLFCPAERYHLCSAMNGDKFMSMQTSLSSRVAQPVHHRYKYSGASLSSTTSSTNNESSSLSLTIAVVQYPSSNSPTVKRPTGRKDEYTSNPLKTKENNNVTGRSWCWIHDHYGKKAIVYTGNTIDVRTTNSDSKTSTQTAFHSPWKREEISEKSNVTKKVSSSIYQIWYDTILIHFLPVQYPTSVQQPGYTRYATFSFIAAMAGSASMVLSTQILLSTMFTVSATPVATNTTMAATAGAFNWVMKDGIGQLGGIIVASQMGHYHAFDNNPKRYRMYAAMLLDWAAMLEISTPLLCMALGSTFHSPATMIVLPLACIATICKNIGFIMASASRATIHQSLCMNNINNQITTTGNSNSDEGENVASRESFQYPQITTTNNNLADVTAKFGSQSTAAGLIGTIIGITFSASSSVNLMGIQQYYSMFGFLLFVGIHQSCNYIALRSVALHHFNRQRLCIVLWNYIHHYRNGADTSNSNALVLSPAQVAEQEYFLPKQFYPFRTKRVAENWLTIGCTLSSICPKGIAQFMQLRNTCPNENYIVNIEGRDEIGNYPRRVQLVFFEPATSKDIIRGMLHAHILHQLLEERLDTDDHFLKVISKSHETVVLLFPSLMRQLHGVGWNTQTVFVEEEPNSFRFMFPLQVPVSHTPRST